MSESERLRRLSAPPRRLIETSFPIAEVSTLAQQERQTRTGNLAALHTYWARKPLSACRTALLAALLPDPTDPNCPASFLKEAPKHLARTGRSMSRLNTREGLSEALSQFVQELATPEGGSPGPYLDVARALVRTAGAEGDLVVDPFAGGGSIPLEALRLGLPAWAGDLNPVAGAMLRALLEDLPRYGDTLAEELGRQAAWVMERARMELAKYYPGSNAAQGRPFAYRWLRTAACEGPGCGADVPLMSQPWLSQRRRVALRLVASKRARTLDLELVRQPAQRDVPSGTIRRGNLTCPLCGFTTPVARIRAQSQERLLSLRLAVVVVLAADGSRDYRLPTAAELAAVKAASTELAKRRQERAPGVPSPTPEEPLPPPGTLGFRVRAYGFSCWGELFMDRQLLTLTTLVRLVREVGDRLEGTGRERGFVRAVMTLLGFLLDRTADYNSAFCRWVSGQESASNTFARTAFPMLMDPVEINPLVHPSADWTETARRMAVVVREVGGLGLVPATVVQASATRSPLPDQAAKVVFTDPPYYDAIPYADLSDFFHVWLRRSIGGVHPDLFSTATTPKDDEIVVNQGWRKDRGWFEAAMTRAFSEARRVLDPAGIAVVVFAHRSTEGWEALLAALLSAGWTVTASWPVRTEMAGRLRALNSATLESSIHLVCRPRPVGTVGDWRDVQDEVGPRVRAWLPRLVAAGIIGADAIFACIGPALEIFSRYDRVERSSGDPVSLREFLQVVWSAVAREALAMVFTGADASGFEADARVTAMWLWTLRMHGVGPTSASEDDDDAGADDQEDEEAQPRTTGFGLPFDAALRIAQSLGAGLDGLPTLVEVVAHQARLLGVQERARWLLRGPEAPEAPRARRGRRQQVLFDSLEEIADATRGTPPQPGATVLDRVHQAMLLFGSGQGDILRRFLVDGGVGRHANFWELAQALAMLYPEGADERRWVLGILSRRRAVTPGE